MEGMAFVKELIRGTSPGSGYLWVPVINTLRPSFSAEDQPRKEFRSHAGGLGRRAGSERRLSSKFDYAPEIPWHPGVELGALFAHVLGQVGPRAAVDVSAYRGLIRPAVMPYGEGQALGSRAIGWVPNTDEAGATKSQYWGGWRPTGFSLGIKNSEDVIVTFEGAGPGPYVGSPNQAATGGEAYPAARRFMGHHAKFYLGPAANASRTGVAPDFSNIEPGTLQRFKPDEFNFKFNPGWQDKAILDGVQGATKTHRPKDSPVVVEWDFTIDYEDPASGFKSKTEFEKQFSGPNATGLMAVLDTGEVAGDTTETYKAVIDLPHSLLKHEPLEAGPEGDTVVSKFSGAALLDESIGYPVALMLTDKVADYLA